MIASSFQRTVRDRAEQSKATGSASSLTSIPCYAVKTTKNAQSCISRLALLRAAASAALFYSLCAAFPEARPAGLKEIIGSCRLDAANPASR
jgi:hypothetical protein